MKKLALFSIILGAAIVGCSSEPTGTPEQDQQKVMEANKEAVESPTSGAANPDAGKDAGP